MGSDGVVADASDVLVQFRVGLGQVVGQHCVGDGLVLGDGGVQVRSVEEVEASHGEHVRDLVGELAEPLVPRGVHQEAVEPAIDLEEEARRLAPRFLGALGQLHEPLLVLDGHQG